MSELDEARRVICEWMQEKPKDGHGPRVETPEMVGHWWYYNYSTRPVIATEPHGRREFVWTWHANESLTLDDLHQVEERLSDKQWDRYDRLLGRISRSGLTPHFGYIHASAEQKSIALAAVLREEKRIGR